MESGPKRPSFGGLGCGLVWREASTSKHLSSHTLALMIRIGFGGILYYNYNKEPLTQFRQLLRPLYQVP